MSITKVQRRQRYITHTERISRRDHREHVRDAHRWARETAGNDWVLVKSPPHDKFGRIYVWAGPPGTGARIRCFGTEHSQLFLAHLREGLAAYREAFARQVDQDPESIEEYTPGTLLDWTI